MKNPKTFGQLLLRLTSPSRAAIRNQGPVIASATELAGGAENSSPSWVILHSITDSELRLIHSHPLESGKLAVRIAAAGGEILRVVLSTAGSEQKGELYETTAQFLL